MYMMIHRTSAAPLPPTKYHVGVDSPCVGGGGLGDASHILQYSMYRERDVIYTTFEESPSCLPISTTYKTYRPGPCISITSDEHGYFAQVRYRC